MSEKTFEQKRDACVLFMRAHARLSSEAADKILLSRNVNEISIITDEMFEKADKLEVEEFYYE